MRQFQFEGGQVLFPGWSQTNHAGLGTSSEAPRPQSCNAAAEELGSTLATVG